MKDIFLMFVDDDNIMCVKKILKNHLLIWTGNIPSCCDTFYLFTSNINKFI